MNERVSVAGMTHTRSVDAYTSATARVIFLIRWIPRTHGNRTVQPLVRRTTLLREALANAVAEGVVSAVVADAVAVAVVQTVKRAARFPRRRELALARSGEPVANTAIIALVAHLRVTQVVEITHVVRARDVGTVKARVSCVAHAKVVHARPVS